MQLKQKRKRRKKRFPNRQNSAKHFKEWATKGRDLIVNGKQVHAYTRAKLLEAFAFAGVPKTGTTLRVWEKNGILPKSPLVVSGKFYYTESMIKAIVLSYLETGQGKRMTSTELFKNTLWERFNNAVKKEFM